MSQPFELGAATVEANAALGAAFVPWVGKSADLLLLDPLALDGVRVTPAAAGVAVDFRFGGQLEARLEQGVVHGAEVELAEARVGWRDPKGFVGLGVGRAHVPYSLDRRYEQEDLALAFRPLISRLGLPLHATGFDGGVAWPERARLIGGAFWATPTADAPHLWARVDVTPLGPLPDQQDGRADDPRFAVGGGLVERQSPLLGPEWTVCVDGAFYWHSLGVDGGWSRQDKDGAVIGDGWLGASARLVAFDGGSDLYLAARGERLTGLVPGEDWRGIGLGRLSWRTRGAWAAVYVEGEVSREVGRGTGGGGDDVVDLGRAERGNDWVAIGVWTRW